MPAVNRRHVGGIIFLLAVAADRATKYLALSGALGELYFNRGISFSLMDRYASAGVVSALAGMGLLLFACGKSAAFRAMPGLPFLWAGSLSNLADRLVYGHVVDWVRVIFFINLADVWLCIGGILLLRHCFSFAQRK
jgi:lipoprotein signal peptidase